eukprot:6169686-Pyramimonas_sp.AAC.1
MTDQSDEGSAGIFSRQTNQTKEPPLYSHGRPIRRRNRRYILTADQSHAGSAGIFSRQTNHTQDAPGYSHGRPITRRTRRPIRHRTRRYILMTDQSDAGHAVVRAVRGRGSGRSNQFKWVPAEREYTLSGHQSRKGRENIPLAGTNRGRGERIYP